MSSDYEPKILIISTAQSYMGIDNAGQGHMDYSTKTYVIRVPDPVIFRIDFYIDAFKMGYDGILIASDGNDGPFNNTFPKLTDRVDKTVQEMKKEGIDFKRLKLTAVCSVCSKHFIKELNSLINDIKDLGPIMELVAAT